MSSRRKIEVKAESAGFTSLLYEIVARSVECLIVQTLFYTLSRVITSTAFGNKERKSNRNYNFQQYLLKLLSLRQNVYEYFE